MHKITEKYVIMKMLLKRKSKKFPVQHQLHNKLTLVEELFQMELLGVIILVKEVAPIIIMLEELRWRHKW